MVEKSCVGNIANNINIVNFITLTLFGAEMQYLTHCVFIAEMNDT